MSGTRVLLVVATVIALTAGCGGAGTNQGRGPTTTATNAERASEITVRSVPPAETDPRIDQRAGDHLVAVPANGTSIERLLVWFPGTRGRPDQYTALVHRAAELGYHVVSLDYENSKAINFQVCPNQPAGCHEASRLEILTGADSDYIEPDVDATNAAFNRLIQLLAHEHELHPNDGWVRTSPTANHDGSASRSAVTPRAAVTRP